MPIPRSEMSILALAMYCIAIGDVPQVSEHLMIRNALWDYSEWHQKSIAQRGYDLRRNPDRAMMEVRAYKVPIPQQPFHNLIRTGFPRDSLAFYVRNAAYERLKGSFSGLHLGESVEREDNADNISVNVLNCHFRVSVEIGYYRFGLYSNYIRSSIDREGDKRDVEGIARKIIASIAGENSSQRPNATVNGQSMPCRKGAEGKDMVPLASWCSATGISVSTNSRLGTAVFTRNGKPVIIALGARAIKVGPDWRDLGDTIALHDGKWYVPLAALEATGS